MQDSGACLKLYYELWEDSNKGYLATEMQLIPILIEMSNKGLLIDQEARQEVEEELTEQSEYYFNLCEKVGFNPGSPQQVAYMLAKRGAYSAFTRLPFTRGRRGSLSTAVEILEKMDDPLASIVLKYRTYSKLLSTYIKPWAKEDRAYTHFHMDAITGRPSSTDRNMQNIPGKKSEITNCRNILLPDSGIWSDMDWSQLELRILAHLSQDKEMLHIYEIGGDIHQTTAEFLNIDRSIAKNVNFCVPITTKALTPNGWRRQDELHKDDLVLGYSPDLESYIWTKVVSIMEPVKDTLIEFGNQFTRLVSTASHRWYGKQRHHWKPKQDYYTNEVKTLREMTSSFNITLASYLDDALQIYTNNHLNITPDEASIIAWLYTDGTINKDKFQSWIFQTKPHNQAKIRNLLSSVPHTEDTPREDGLIVWRLSFPWVRSLLVRANLWFGNLTSFVLSLTDLSRSTFLETCIDAEGWTHMGQLSIGQNIGETLDAIQLAASLEGYFTKVLPHCSEKYPNGRTIRLLKPYITCQRVQTFDCYDDFVWCMQTGVGSWVAKDAQGQIFITGNAMVYGGTDETLAETAHIRSIVRAHQLKEGWFQLFTGVKDYIECKHYEALQTYRARTIFGRNIRLPNEEEERVDGIQRKAVNYPIQGSAAEILKRGLIILKDLPLALQVHDEVLVDGFIPDYVFKPLEEIASFRTPVEIKYLERWE